MPEQQHTFGPHASALDTWERWQKLVQPIVDAACDLRDARQRLDEHTAKQFGEGSDDPLRQAAWADQRGLLNAAYGWKGRMLDRAVDVYREADDA